MEHRAGSAGWAVPRGLSHLDRAHGFKIPHRSMNCQSADTSLTNYPLPGYITPEKVTALALKVTERGCDAPRTPDISCPLECCQLQEVLFYWQAMIMWPPQYLLKGCEACRGDIVLEQKDIRCLQCGRTPTWAFTPMKPGKRRKEWSRKWNPAELEEA